MALLKKQLSKVLEREIKIFIKEARNLAIPYCKEPSKPLVIYNSGKSEVIVEPCQEHRPPRSPNVRFDHEGVINPGFELRLQITVRDNGINVGSCKISYQKLNRGLKLSNWYVLKPEGQGEIFIEMVAINFGKIAKPLRRQTWEAIQLSNEFLQTAKPITPIPNSDSKPKYLLKEYRKHQIKRTLPHIAAGHFGIVYKGYVRDRKELVAIKDIKVTDYTLFEEWKKEVEFMSQHKNTYIVIVYGFCCSSKMLTIIMEYMEKGSLYDVLHGENLKSLELNPLDRLRMARHVSLSVTFLHVNKILHRDIKSLNILISKDNVCKLSDFGSAKFVSLEQQYYTADVGTPLWMAPEVRFGKAYSLSADVFSLGVVLYEIFENKLPEYDYQQNLIVIQNFNFPAAGIISPMLNLNPKQRPSAEMVAKQLDGVLHYVLDKSHNGVSLTGGSIDLHMTRDSQTANNLVSDGLLYMSKKISEGNDPLLSPSPPDNGGVEEDYLLNEDDDGVGLGDGLRDGLGDGLRDEVWGGMKGFEDTVEEDEDSDEDDLFRNKFRTSSFTGGTRDNVFRTVSHSIPNGRKQCYVGQPYYNNGINVNERHHLTLAESAPMKFVSEFQTSNLRDFYGTGAPGLCKTTHNNNSHLKWNDMPSHETNWMMGKDISKEEKKECDVIIRTTDKLGRPMKGTVLYSFEPENQGEIAVEQDDIIEIIGVKGEWIECLTQDNHHGWVPFNYVQIDGKSPL